MKTKIEMKQAEKNILLILILLSFSAVLLFSLTSADSAQTDETSIPDPPFAVDTSLGKGEAELHAKPSSPAGDSEFQLLEKAMDEEPATSAEEAVLVDAAPPENPEDDSLSPGEGVVSYMSLDYDEDFLAGLRSYHSGELEETINYLINYLVSEPSGENLSAANFILGLSLFRLGDFDSAIGFLKTAGATLSAAGDYALYFSARSLEQLGEYEKAAQEWQELLRKYPYSRLKYRALYHLGFSLFNSGDVSGAKLSFQEIIDAGKEAGEVTAGAYFYLAKIAQAYGDNRLAVEIFNNLFIKQPVTKQALDAASELKKLKANKVPVPSLSMAQKYQRVKNLFNGGMVKTAYNEAVDLEAALANYKRTPELHAKVLLFLAEEGSRGKNGKEWLQKVVALQGAPKGYVAKASLLLARMSAKKGENEAAIKEFLSIYDKFKGETDGGTALFYAAWFTANSNNREKAITLFIKFVNEFPSHEKTGDGLWYAGWHNYRLKKYSEAIKWFARLAEFGAPHDMGQKGQYWLGRSYEQLGQTAEAISAYQKAAKSYYVWFYSFLAETRIARLRGAKETDLSPALVMFKPSTATYLSTLENDKNTDGVDEFPESIQFHLNNSGFLLDLGFVLTAHREIASSGELPPRTPPEEVLRLARLYSSRGDYYDAFALVRERFMSLYLALPGSAIFSNATEVWEHAYPRGYNPLVSLYARENSIPPSFVFAIMREESHFFPEATSWVGARGLMQVMPSTGRQIADRLKIKKFQKNDLYNTETNIKMGAWYLGNLLKQFNGSLLLASAAYNGGPGAVKRWLDMNSALAPDEFVEEITFLETRQYVMKVLKTYIVYRRLYEDPNAYLTPKELLLNKPEFESVNF